jgi:hypothetical protein
VPGEILECKTYPFEFSTVEMQYESYNGVNVRLRYSMLPYDKSTQAQWFILRPSLGWLVMGP